jgi:hypothetical protein
MLEAVIDETRAESSWTKKIKAWGKIAVVK